jgi:hypothetical protein
VKTAYQLSEQVQQVMEQTAITMDDLLVMLNRSATITHPSGCNRRYHGWLLHVQDDLVLRMQKLEMTDYSQGCKSQIEECDECFGDGCIQCGWIGQVKRLATS